MPPPPLDSQYSKVIAKSVDYTATASDDQINYTVAVPRTLTLPKARECTYQNGQFQKRIVSVAASADLLSIAVQSGDTLVGASGISASQTLVVSSDGVLTWTSIGRTGVSGVSGFSGFSGASAYSGKSGWSGYSGVSGYSGYCGVSGYTGKSGYSGFTGISGYSGFSGISGYSGFSG